jgi:peptidyl-prolyl cis-trans isomerase A (cyclophilin A)
MKIVHWLIASVILASAGAASAQTPPSGDTTKKPSTKTGAATKKPAPAAKRAAFDPALLKPGSLNEKAPENFDAKFTTTKGEFTVHVTRAWAPLGADRFYNLVKHHFYDGAAFFRVLDGFVAQIGLSAYPQVSTAWEKATIKDDPVKQSNKNGFVTFATGGPNTRTTQIFICLGNNSRLDGMGFAPFGQVTDGMLNVVRLYGGYKDSPDRGGAGPDQGKIEKLGKAYLDKGWPKLDSVQKAVIVSPPGAAGSAAKAPAATKQ